jgi:lysophospholipase L1-like esterase
MTREIPTSQSGMRDRALRFLYIASIQMVIVLALLIVAEIALRSFDPPMVRLPPSDRVWGFRHDPDLGWSLPPHNARQVTVTRTVSMRSNSLGLRDIELAPGSGPTILFLGDSFTEGFDVEPEERFSDRLRANLPGVRILNAGVTGYGTDQEYIQLQRLWSRVEPTVVVLMFCVDNDREDNSSNYRYFAFKPYLANVGGQWQFRGQPVPLSPQILFNENRFALNFATVRLAMVAYSSIKNDHVSVPDPTERLVAMMRDLVEARGAKFLVGLQRQEPSLETFLNSQKIPYTRFDEAEKYPTWGSHWTPTGHASVAARLLALLAKEGAVPAVTESR